MKKIICILLSAVLFFMTTGIPLLAGNIVGNRGNTGTPSDGVQDAPNGTGITTPISVAVTDTVSRYAVDLTYPQGGMVLSFAGDFTWNVNSHTYEGDGTVEDALFVFTLTNHSDQPVYAYGEVTPTPRYQSFFTFALEHTKENRLMIRGVRSGAKAGEEQNMTLTVKADKASIGTLMSTVMASEDSPTAVKLGTLSIVISGEQ